MGPSCSKSLDQGESTIKIETGETDVEINLNVLYLSPMRRSACIPVIFALFASCALSCLHCAATPRRTPTISYPKTSSEHQTVLAVFLPGRGGTRYDLEHYGLLDTLRASGLPVDVIGVHAPMRVYIDRSFHRRVQEDVLKPAADSGYRRIWFIGNSMGGLGTLLYAMKHPAERFEGIVLLGPFLGDKPILGEIDSAGGLLSWSPRDTITDNYQRDLWQYLKRCVTDTTGSFPQLYLCAGTDDGLHRGQQLLATALPADHVFWAPGGHEWDAWRPSFAAFVKYAADKKLFR
jgi:pimeloyl-ACP methyl ester carboxylesterase